MRGVPGLGSAVVVDTDEVWLHATARFLQGYGFHSVKCFTTIHEASATIDGTQSLLLTEVLLGFDTCLRLIYPSALRSYPTTIIAMSDRAPRPHVFRLRDFGVQAYLEKPFGRHALYECLDSVIGIDAPAGPPASVAPQTVSAASSDPRLDPALSAFQMDHQLTSAETHVLYSSIQGMRRIDIARDRCISVNTVKTQVRSILSKTGSTNLQQVKRQAAAYLRDQT